MSTFCWLNGNLQRTSNMEIAEYSNDTTDSSTRTLPTSTLHAGNMSNAPTILLNKRKCYATKCQLLQAKGIIKGPMICALGCSICSGCNNEVSKQCKVLQLKNEMLTLSVNNNILAPLLEYRTKIISIKTFRKILLCLTSMISKSWDDHIFGATRYLANTLGIGVQENLSSNILDSSMTSIEPK